jgi:hypothetical protein
MWSSCVWCSCCGCKWSSSVVDPHFMCWFCSSGTLLQWWQHIPMHVMFVLLASGPQSLCMWYSWVSLPLQQATAEACSYLVLAFLVVIAKCIISYGMLLLHCFGELINLRLKY